MGRISESPPWKVRILVQSKACTKGGDESHDLSGSSELISEETQWHSLPPCVGSKAEEHWKKPIDTQNSLKQKNTQNKIGEN